MTKPVAIVTGASQGIGAAIARRLKERYTLILLARGEGKLNRISQEIGAIPMPCDLTDWSSVQSVFERIAGHGTPGVLVNNAGIGGPVHRIDQIGDAEWQSIFDTNVRALFWMCRHYLPQMKQQGFGRVINISSVLGMVGAAGSTTYTATKHAMIGYTMALACEWGAYGITCNAICPGFINTAMHDASRASDALVPIHNVPVGRLGTVDEVAALVSFLCSPDAGYINGSAIVADGGLTAGSWTEIWER